MSAPNNYTFVTLNIRGTKCPVKRKRILNDLKQHKVDIALQETHLTDAEHDKLKSVGGPSALFIFQISGMRGGHTH